MTRLIYDKESKTFGFEDKVLWFWDARTAMDEYGNDLPCYLNGFDTIELAIANAQSEFYIHENCIPFLGLPVDTVETPALDLYNEMAHGDDKHRNWLLEHLNKWFSNKVVIKIKYEKE